MGKVFKAKDIKIYIGGREIKPIEDTFWIYGHYYKYGWGAMKVQEEPHEHLDFKPEFLSFNDIKSFWKYRHKILSLKEMTVLKYAKFLIMGIIDHTIISLN